MECEIKKRKLETLIIEAVQEVADDDSGLDAVIDEYMREFPFILRMYRAMFKLCIEHLKSVGNFDLDDLDDSYYLVLAVMAIEDARVHFMSKEAMITSVASYVVRYRDASLYRELMKDAWDEARAIYFESCTLSPSAKKILKKSVEEPGYFKDVVWKLTVRNKDRFADFIAVDAAYFYLDDEDIEQMRADLHLSLII